MQRSEGSPAGGREAKRNGHGKVRRGAIAWVSPFGRLIEIVRQNDALLERLDVFERRMSQARQYARDPMADRGLASTLVGHANEGYAAVLAELKSNRTEAFAILGDVGADAEAVAAARAKSRRG